MYFLVCDFRDNNVSLNEARALPSAKLYGPLGFILNGVSLPPILVLQYAGKMNGEGSEFYELYKSTRIVYRNVHVSEPSIRHQDRAETVILFSAPRVGRC